MLHSQSPVDQAPYHRRSRSQSRIRFIDQQQSQEKAEEPTEWEKRNTPQSLLSNTSRQGHYARKKSQEIHVGFQILQVTSPPRTALAENPKDSGQHRIDKIHQISGESKMDRALNFFRSRGLSESLIADNKVGEIQPRKRENTGKVTNGNFQETHSPHKYGESSEQPAFSEGRTSKSPHIASRRFRSTEVGCSQEHTGVMNRCIFNRDSSLLLTVSGDCSCHIFRRGFDKFSCRDSWTKETTLRGHQIGTWGVAISANDDFVFTVGGDGKVCFWLVGTKTPPMMDATEIRKILGRRGENSTGTHEEVFRRLRAVMSIDEDTAKRNGFHEQYVKSERQWLCASTLACEPPGGAPAAADKGAPPPAFDCSLHPSNDMLATAWGDGAVRLFRGVRNGTVRSDRPAGFVHEHWAWRCVQTVRDHADSAFSCGFDPSGGTLATASKDGTVVLYGVGPSGLEKRRALAGHMGPILGLSHHPCGRLMASASCDTNVVVWFLSDIEGAGPTWLSIGTLFGHGDFVKACSFRADGQLLATASRDKTVRLWKMVSSPTQVSQLRKFICLEVIRCSEELCCVQFASGARIALLVAGTLAGRIYFWNTETCLKCSNPIMMERTKSDFPSVNSGLNADDSHTILFENEGRFVPPPPQTAMHDWSRIETPNHTAPEPSAMAAAARQAIIYHDTDHLMNSVAGFQTMNPSGEPQASSVICKRIKDYTAETKAAQTAIQLSKPEGTKADIKKIENISKVLLQELDIDHRVKLKRDALQAVMQHSAYLDTESITLMLTKIISAVHDLLQYGKLIQRFPELQRYKNGPRWLLGKEELKELLETSNATHKPTRRPATQSSKKGNDLVKHSDLGDSLEPAGLENERGGQLALDLSSKTIGEAKRILGERIIKLIEPELTWTKDAEKISGNIAAQIVSTFDDNSADSPNFRNVCYLVFNLRRLYSQALNILKDINTAHHQIKDSSLMKDRSGVSNLPHWSGHEGCQSLAGNRCSPPLYSSTSPTTIGIIFVPHCNCELVRFTTFLCLATTKTTREARDRDRSKALGVSFKFLVLKWNLQTRNTEDVIYMSEEQMVTEHSFERFVLNCERNSHISVQSNQAVMLALTSSSCEAYCKGAAWVSGLGLKDKKGAKTPEPAEMIREGTFVFAGLPDGDPRNVWMKLDETMACEIEYNTVN